MVKEGNDEADAQLKALFKSLARRNLRRGYNLRLPTGQALHKLLKQNGAVQSAPIADVSTIFNFQAAVAGLPEELAVQIVRTDAPVVLYSGGGGSGGGNRLGEVGSFLVASTFVGVLLADPDSALSRSFDPSQSPLRMSDNSPIDSLAKWMRFASVME